MSASPSPARAWLVPTVLLLASAGVAALWALLALALNRQCSWMAVVAAIDLLVLARVLGLRNAPLLSALAVAGTALSIWLANWWIVAGQMAAAMGMPPWQSVPLIGFDLVWYLAELANTRHDHLWWLAGLAVAAIGGLWWGRRTAITPSARSVSAVE